MSKLELLKARLQLQSPLPRKVSPSSQSGLQISDACLYLYCKLSIERGRAYSFIKFRQFAEYIGGYSYVLPDDRILNKDLFLFLISTSLPLTEVLKMKFVLELYTNGSQTKAFELLLAANSAQLSSQVSTR